jgi:hypothetical protein
MVAHLAEMGRVATYCLGGEHRNTVGWPSVPLDFYLQPTIHVSVWGGFPQLEISKRLRKRGNKIRKFHQLRFIEEASGWFWIREFSLAECPE